MCIRDRLSLLILGWNGSRNSWNLILSRFLGLGIFLGQVEAKLANLHFGRFYWKCYFTNFAPTHPTIIPSPKISLKIKFYEFLDPFQPKISRPNNFFGVKIGQFWLFLANNCIQSHFWFGLHYFMIVWYMYWQNFKEMLWGKDVGVLVLYTDDLWGLHEITYVSIGST